MATPSELSEIHEAAQDAADAAYGDSNDEEIDAYRHALGLALNALGLEMPEPRDPDEDLGLPQSPADVSPIVDR